MKRLFIAFLFLLVSLPALAQTPEDRGELLTEKMDSLFSSLSLTSQQREALRIANIKRYEIEAEFKQELLQDAQYQAALANNFQTPAEQEILQRIEKRKQKEIEDIHNQAIADVIQEVGYFIYGPQKSTLLQIVINIFGE